MEYNEEGTLLNIGVIKEGVCDVAKAYNIEKVLIFGSYFDGQPTARSDVDLLVSYGDECRGLKRIGFMQDMEKKLGKKIDVLNIDFLPQFLKKSDLSDARRVLYDRQNV